MGEEKDTTGTKKGKWKGERGGGEAKKITERRERTVKLEKERKAQAKTGKKQKRTGGWECGIESAGKDKRHRESKNT